MKEVRETSFVPLFKVVENIYIFEESMIMLISEGILFLRLANLTFLRFRKDFATSRFSRFEEEGEVRESPPSISSSLSKICRF